MKNQLLRIILLIMISQTARAQSPVLSPMPALHRLPVNAIHRIFQDSEGYMWYGTVNGLCRDDGYQIKVFRTDFNQRGLLADNLIECITEDNNGYIWFGTDKGAYQLEKRTYRVKEVNETRNKMVHQMYRTRDGHIWIALKDSLLEYDAHQKLKTVYSTEGCYAGGFCQNRNGEIIVSLQRGGLYRIDSLRRQLDPYVSTMSLPNPGWIIQDTRHSYYWVGSWGRGIYRFDPSMPEDMQLEAMSVTQAPASDPRIIYFTQELRSGDLWVTTSTGLSYYTVNNHRIERKISFVNEGRSVMLNDVIFDKMENLWVSAFDCPSFIIHRQTETPRFHALPALKSHTDFQSAIMTIAPAGNNLIWIFQERTGVFLYNLEKEHAVWHKDFKTTFSLPLGLVKLMAPSKNETDVWVVPEHGLQAFLFSHDYNSIYTKGSIDIRKYANHKSITAMLETADGETIWLGTQVGLIKYEPAKNTIKELHPHIGHVSQLQEDKEGNIWISTTDKGLYKMQKELLLHANFPQAFSCLSIADNGLLWLGSHEGDLLSYDPLTHKSKSYNRICHLDGNMVNRIFTDEFGQVWASTNQEVIELNPQNDSYRTYQTTDLASRMWRFIPTAACKTPDGHIYFGGMPGILEFTPSNSLERRAGTVKTVITDVTVNGRSLPFDLHQSIHADSLIELAPDEERLNIFFSSLQHLTAAKTRYAYRLKDVDKDWQYTSEGENKAVYNNLPSGDHVFEVKATDNNGLWSQDIAYLRIYKRPPIYATPWAIALYVFALVALTLLLFRIYVRRLEKKNEELWSDSEEMLRMRLYLKQQPVATEEDAQLDRIFIDKMTDTIVEYIETPDFDVSKLASLMNMSRSTLTRKLKAITGKTPLDFIRHLKMEKACQLLNDRNKTISEVALMLGYYDRKYFTICFKEEFGITPSEYRNMSAIDKQDTSGM